MESKGPQHTVELELARPPAADEAVHVRVTAGVLPDGARIVARLASGEIIGAVSPYGIRAGEKAGTYAMALPRDQGLEGPVQLNFQLDIAGESPRAPTASELEAVELVFIDIAPPVRD
ncbi:MAG: hypothetical protein AAF560_18235 [Acidobacteriota bacterium]